MSWNWRVLDAGRFALDGGSMFGVVPKALWSKSSPQTLTTGFQKRVTVFC